VDVTKAKKKGATPKRYGTLIRVSDRFADALRDAAGFERMSATRFADTVLLPVVRKRYRDGVLRMARRLEGDAVSGRATASPAP
jgi:hypothetical protein